MIVTFCGHSDFFESIKYENLLIDILEREIGACSAEMYLGGYGGFDSFAYACCKKFKSRRPNISLVFITPYLNVDPILVQNYDSVIYPALEEKPKRYAISYRNKFMVEKADLIIAYINHNWGGAYKTYEYAMRKSKRIINLYDIKSE